MTKAASSTMLVPSLDIADIARVEGDFLVLELQPGSAAHRRLDRYRVRLDSLGSTVQSLV